MSAQLDKARTLAELGRLESARGVLAEALATEPDNADLLAELANTHLRLSDYRQALDVSTSALRHAPDDTYAWRVRALAELQLARAGGNSARAREHRTAAIAAARRACELEPKYADNHRVLAATQRDTNPKAALSSTGRALELDPDDISVHLLRGMILRENLLQPDRAEAAFRKVLELDPERVEALYHLALVEWDRRNYVVAERELRRVAQLDPVAYAEAVRGHLTKLAADARSGGKPETTSGGRRFARWAGVAAVFLVIRLVIAATDSDSPADRQRYTPNPAIPSNYYRPPTFYQRPSFPAIPTIPPDLEKYFPSNVPRPPARQTAPAAPATPRATVPGGVNPFQ